MTAIIFDTEMHQLDGDVIEAAWLAVEITEQTHEEDSFHLLMGLLEPAYGQSGCKRFKPSQPIAFGAMAVHHIIDADLIDCPPHTDFKLPVFDTPIQYIIGHNVDCDTQAINRCGVDTSAIKSICTLAMARNLWPDLDAHNLSALAYRFAYDKKAMREHLKNAHNAFADCVTTITLLEEIIREKNITSIEQLYDFSQLARIPTHMPWGKHKGVLIHELPYSYKNWLFSLADLDPYLRQALEAPQPVAVADDDLPF